MDVSTRWWWAINFITGIGGFLQALIFGYSGLRLNVEALTIDGDIPLPRIQRFFIYTELNI